MTRLAGVYTEKAAAGLAQPKNCEKHRSEDRPLQGQE